MKKLRVIGDIHGDRRFHEYCIRTSPASISLGDVGFTYNYLDKHIGPSHRAIAGNHDNYDYQPHPFFLGDSGVWSSVMGEIFFVRGASSIDRHLRTATVDWWLEEELNREQQDIAFEQYLQSNAEIIISHDCPASIQQFLIDPRFPFSLGLGRASYTSATNFLLEKILRHRPPKLWFFGHYHRTRIFELPYGEKTTIFACIDQGSFVDWEPGFLRDEKGNILRELT